MFTTPGSKIKPANTSAAGIRLKRRFDRVQGNSQVFYSNLQLTGTFANNINTVKTFTIKQQVRFWASWTSPPINYGDTVLVYAADNSNIWYQGIVTAVTLGSKGTSLSISVYLFDGDTGGFNLGHQSWVLMVTPNPSAWTGDRLVSASPSTGSSPFDMVIPSIADRVLLTWSGVSFTAATRDLRIQALSAASTPDTTAANYPGFVISNTTTPAVSINSVASFIATPGSSSAAHTMRGWLELSGLRNLAQTGNGTITFKSYWYGSGLDTARGSMQGEYIGTALYGLRLTCSNATFTFDGSGTAWMSWWP